MNPITGEGIDLAIESAEMAARHMLRLPARTPWNRLTLAPFELALRRRFELIFRGARPLQKAAINERYAESIVWRAARNREFASVALQMNLGLTSALSVLRPGVLWAIAGPPVRKRLGLK